MPDIVLTIRLTEEDWDQEIRGWRCPVLSVPGAVVEAIYVEGNRIDSARSEVLAQNTFLRWITPDQPHRVAVSIKLTEPLSLGSETERWKRLAIILPVAATIVASLISGFATYFSHASDVHPASPMADTHTSGAAQPTGSTETRPQAAQKQPYVLYVDAVNSNNTTFGSALPIEIGKTYRSRFLGDDSSRFFAIHQANGQHDLDVEFGLVGPDTEVRPIIFIYDTSRKKLFSRYHANNDNKTINWTVPTTPGDYVAEVKPATSSGDFADFLLSVAAR